MLYSLAAISLAARSLSNFFKIFPLAFFGMASTNLIPPSRFLYLASRALEYRFASSSVN